MSSDSMQTHLLRLQEIMAKSAAAPAPKAPTPIVPQHSSRTQAPTKAVPAFTEWRPALKYVTRHVAQSPEIEGSIRKMVSEHRQHEQQWWRERQKTTNVSELKEYDTKVYKAQQGMQEYMAKQLHALGIPFFASATTNMASDRLLELQRQMLEHLESAYGPD